MSDKVILITGSNGFLGRNLLEQIDIIPGLKILTYRNTRLLPEYRDNKCLVRLDLTNSEHVSRFFENYKEITDIIHLAASSSSRNNPADIVDNNIKSTLNLLEYCNQGTNFIFASSVLVYGSRDTSCFYETDVCKPTSVYGVTKLSCEHLIELYYRKNKVRPRILRFSNIIGKYLTHGRIWEVLCQNKNNVELYGNYPGSSLPFITAKSAVAAIIEATLSNRATLKCNIAPEDNLSLAKAFEMCGNARNKPVEVSFKPTGIENDYVCCYNSEADYQLGLKITKKSEEALQDGINELLNDYKPNNMEFFNTER